MQDALTLPYLDQLILLPEGNPNLPGPVDLGPFRELHLCVRVLSPGTAASAESGGTGTATLDFEHAPRDGADAWLDFPEPVSIDLATQGSTWIVISKYTRLVRARVSGTLASAATVSVDLVARP